MCNISVVHKLSDLRAQSDDGTAAAKISRGILADTETRILFAHPASEIAEAEDLFGLTPSEAAKLPTLGVGEAMWQVGTQRAVIRHRIGPQEWVFAQTDKALAI